ncbi:hypothetical protein G7046_g2662 [Stylonectria norvegica]|nr:hypothetical protein G7046_g2662 [Stylonectria norvegica]
MPPKFKPLKLLDHAPASSHGTYINGISDGLESLEYYEEGGYHPVHLGEYLGSARRYRVLHKLGHGGSGTVWLCRDEQDEAYVATKVSTSDSPQVHLRDLSLGALDMSQPGAEYIAVPLDHFSLDGPNGTHHCTVLPLLGPRVAPSLWFQVEEPHPMLRKMARQATEALLFLHQHSICHGDFRPANILVKLGDLSHLSEDQIMALLGQPETSEVATDSSSGLPSSAPEYLVIPAKLAKLGAQYLLDQICVIDFGESFSFASPPANLGIPESYVAPELILDEPPKVGPACDIWALACTILEIRCQLQLFYMLHDTDELIAEMVGLFGKLPEPWWTRWAAHEKYFTAEGDVVTSTAGESMTLEKVISHVLEVFRRSKDGRSTMKFSVPVEEQGPLGDLLHKLFRYNPEERLSIAEALNHNRFKMDDKGADREEKVNLV